MDPIRRAKYLALFFVTSWLGIVLTSCATLSGCNACRIGVNHTEPYNPPSFALIEVDLFLTPSNCIVKGTGEKCDDLLTRLPPKVISTRGSGTIVKVVNNKTYVLTADHVCHHPPRSSFEMPFSSAGENKPPRVAIITVDQKTLLVAVDGDGVRHESKVHATDSLNDVCIVVSPGGWGVDRAVDVAQELPAIGATVYNIAAPFGIFEPGVPGVKLHFEGKYSGHDTRGNYFYTVPARPGSSGSSVLNEDGKIIGVVHSAMISFEHVALASSLISVQALMATIPKPEPPMLETSRAHQDEMHYLLFGF